MEHSPLIPPVWTTKKHTGVGRVCGGVSLWLSLGLSLVQWRRERRSLMDMLCRRGEERGGRAYVPA